MSKTKDEHGNRYGRLLVVGAEAGARWLCRCDCGSVLVVAGRALRSGNTSSCGCSRRVHGHTAGRAYHPLYWTWCNIRKRCYSPSRIEYAAYGGRGITMCAAWRASFAAFLADVGERPPGCTLDRIDNDGAYEPGNVRWATHAEQQANRRCSSTPCARERAELHARIAQLEAELCHPS